MNKSKKRTLNLIFGLSACIGLSSISFLHPESDSSIVVDQIVNSAASGSGTDTSWTEQTLTFTVDPNPSWKGKYFADQATNEMIKSMLIPDKKYGANYFVKLLPITEDMILNGYVYFVVGQIKNDYNTSPTTSAKTSATVTKKIEYITPTEGYKAENVSGVKNVNGNSNIDVDGESISVDKVWTSTKNDSQISSGKLQNKSSSTSNQLFLSKKYSFKWNTNKEIGDYLSNESMTKTTLSSDDILNNMVSKSDSTDFLPANTNANFKQEGTSTGQELSNPYSIISNKSTNTDNVDTISSNDAKTYGVGIAEVTFPQNDTNGNSWTDGKIPTDTKRVVRGLTTTSNGKHELQLNRATIRDKKFDLNKIKLANPNFKTPSRVNGSNIGYATINQFSPTEFLNALNGNLLPLLTTTDYLYSEASSGSTNNNSLPAIYPTYMGKNPFTDKNLPFKGTGLSWHTNVEYVDVNYNPILNSDGTAKTTGNQGANSAIKVKNIEAHANDLTGVLELKIVWDYYDVFYNVMVEDYVTTHTIDGMVKNPDGNKNLYFNWKNEADLPFSNVDNLMQIYNSNKDDVEFMNELANSFYFGSNDTYSKNKKLEISNSSRNENVTVKITFDNFGLEKNKVFSKTFNIPSKTNVVNFKTQDELNEALNGTLKNYTPEELINKIATGEISDSIFVNGSKNGATILISQNSTSDGIIVEAIDSNGNSSWYAYTGLKQGTSSAHVYNFSFSSNLNDEGYLKLTSQAIEEITVQEVIDLYLVNIPPFNAPNSQYILSEENVKIYPNEDDGTLKVEVTIDQFDEADPSVNKVFTTTIKGLKTQTLVDNNSYVKPLNLTIPLSATFAALVTIGLTTVLVLTIIKRVKLSKSKKQ